MVQEEEARLLNLEGKSDRRAELTWKVSRPERDGLRVLCLPPC